MARWNLLVCSSQLLPQLRTIILFDGERQGLTVQIYFLVDNRLQTNSILRNLSHAPDALSKVLQTIIRKAKSVLFDRIKATGARD